MFIKIPQSVYYDTLDPTCSGMEAELELPEPSYAKRGRGGTFTYEGVTPEQAEEVAQYIGDRGVMLLNQPIDDPRCPIEKRERDIYRAAVKTAEKIRSQMK